MNKDDQIDFEKEALGTITSLGRVYERASNDRLALIKDFRKERRALFKYLATIAGGAAALSPQMIGFVIQTEYFYIGILSLTLSLIIGITYLLSTNENEYELEMQTYDRILKDIENVKEPWVNFIEIGDYSKEKWIIAHKLTKQANEKIKLSLQREGNPNKENFYIPREYTSEYLILFFVVGVGSITLSTTSYYLPISNYILITIGVLATIVMLGIFPNKIFEKLGFPIDFIRGVFRFLLKNSK